jgi:hypothetical protein
MVPVGGAESRGERQLAFDPASKRNEDVLQHQRISKVVAAFAVALIIAVLAVWSVQQHPASAATVVPLSQGMPVTASSVNSASYVAANGNDGSLYTSWMADHSTFPQWWCVDLGAGKALAHVTIAWRQSNDPSLQYVIEGSNDNAAWTTMCAATKASAVATTDDTVSGSWRYVRIQVTGSANGGRAGFWECSVYGTGAPTPTPTTSATPTPTPTASVKPTTTPTPTPTPTAPSPTPTPTPTATAPAAPNASLLWTTSEITAVKAKIAAGTQPFAAAYSAFVAGDLKTALSGSPSIVVGPTTASGAGCPLDTQLTTDGAKARAAGIGYALTGTTADATKARQYIVAWAQGNHPSNVTQMGGDVWGGTYVGSGLFGMAFSYDLTKGSGVYSGADKTAIQNWFSAWATALQTFMDKQACDPIFASPSGTKAYPWVPNPGMSYNLVDYYTGGDCTGRTEPGELAAAIEGGNQTILSKLYSSSWALSVPNVIRSSCAPRNTGDNAGTDPVPQVQVFKPGSADNPGRGGNVDYMTYNERESTLLYELSANLGKATATQLSEVKTSWTYLSKFFGSGARGPIAPNDTINTAADLPRLQMAYHLFGGATFASDVAGQTNLRETQFLGPTILTQPAL